MWCGRFSSPQLGHSFGLAGVKLSWARRLLRRDFDTLFCCTAIEVGLWFGSAAIIRGCEVFRGPGSGVYVIQVRVEQRLGKAPRHVQPKIS